MAFPIQCNSSKKHEKKWVFVFGDQNRRNCLFEKVDLPEKNFHLCLETGWAKFLVSKS